MWYAGGLVVHQSDIGYATSTDGVTWYKYAGNPVLERGSAGSWDASSGFKRGPSCGTAPRTHLWFTGGPTRRARPRASQTGLATSPDGVTWTEYAGQPGAHSGGR